MLAAARTAATAAGYNYTNYTHEVVVTGDKPDVGFGGIAYVGARGAWLANSQWNLGVCSHEVGHNFGLNHSGFWDTDDGTTIGSGAAVEYGNPFDHMGGASSSTDAHFGARQKNYLDWIVDADVVKITTDGTTTTRIRAFDQSRRDGRQGHRRGSHRHEQRLLDRIPPGLTPTRTVDEGRRAAELGRRERSAT